MSKVRLAVAGAALGALLVGVPFVAGAFGGVQNVSAGGLLDTAIYLCIGARAGSPSPDPGWGGAHDHATTPGVYMPMFSAPPKGGAVYNGPPLDDC